MNAFCNVVDTLPFNVLVLLLMLGCLWWKQWSCHVDLRSEALNFIFREGTV
jgi:hypothetical protein